MISSWNQKKNDSYLLEMIVNQKKNPYKLLRKCLIQREHGVYRALFNDIHIWTVHWDMAKNSSKK